MSNPHVEVVEEFPENPNVQAVETVTPPNTSERVDRYNKLTPAQAITAAGGIVMLVLGLIAVARTGVSDGMKLPTTSVAGFTFSPILAIITAVAGLILLAAAFSSRNSSVFFGVLLAIAGVVGVAATSRFRSIAVTTGYCWMLVIVGVVITLANLFLPTVTTRKVTYR